MPRPSTFHFCLGLIGHPLGHSLSPKIHTAALKACGLDGNYSLFPIPPEDEQGLKDLSARVRAGEIHGLNVTIPHKQKVMEYLDELTPAAEAIGAVNTIYLRDETLIGNNTDAPAFLSDLKKFLGAETQNHEERNALVLGAGGSARAVVYALLNDGWEVTIAARRSEQAQQLASSFKNYQLQITDHNNLQPSTFDLLVNATPIGMTPNAEQSPWPREIPFPANATVYDLVYNPRETKLVKDARKHGLKADGGLGMLIEQAALAFQIWTGFDPPREPMHASINQPDHYH